MSKFFYNIADKNVCFLINCKILVTRDTITNASIGRLRTWPQSSGLNENSFCKTEKENSLIYSLTINENEAETKVKGLKVHLKLKYSHVLKKSWSMVWIC